MWKNRNSHMLLCGVVSHFSRVRLSVTPWTVAHQAPLSMGFSRQKYWSELPCLPPGDLPDPRIKPAPLTSSVLAGGFFTTSATQEAQNGPPAVENSLAAPQKVKQNYHVTQKFHSLAHFKKNSGDFHSSPMVKIPCFQSKRHRFNPWLRN